MSSSPKARIITLGCAKNDVDSEEIAGVLSKEGYRLNGAASSDITIINTCGFLEASKQESIRAIRKAVREKKQGRTKKVIVAGCLSQRLGAELERLAPGADMYVGVGQMAKFGALAKQLLAPSSKLERKTAIEPPQHWWADVKTRARTGAPWSAYLKVSEGCDHRCTFCTIPSFRGKHVSKPLERIIDEARYLAATGAREINLVAQDVTQYGYDLYREFTMPKLLRELSKVEGIRWIRLLYCYPNRLTSEVIAAMAESPKVANYIDVPLQHAHRDILRAMKRPWDGERYLSLFADLRRAMPDVAIRSTFIVGFPGETEEHFDYLLSFIEAARLDKVGAFTYSREPGTPSHDYADQVADDEKAERYERLMLKQQEISKQINSAWVGKRLQVLVESQKEDWSIGRSHRDAPDIDGLVYVSGLHQPGAFIETEITGSDEYDLFGKLKGARELVPLRTIS